MNDNNLVEPILGDALDQEDVVSQSDSVQEASETKNIEEETSETDRLGLDLVDEKERTEKEIEKTDPRVKRLEEVIEEAGLIAPFEGEDAIKMVMDKDEREHEGEVMLDNM